MRWFLVSASLLSLASSPAVSAAPGPRVPMASAEGELEISIPGDDPVSTSGAFPLVLPFDLAAFFGCSASGTATVDVVDGAVEVRVEGVDMGGASANCTLSADFSLQDPKLQVPDIGESVTPVYGSLSGEFAATGNIVEDDRFASFEGSHESAILGARVRADDFDLNKGPGFGFEISGPVFYVAGDTVTPLGETPASGRATWTSSASLGTLDATVFLEFFTPPTSGPLAPATSPAARIALVAALLTAAGVLGARRLHRPRTA